MTFNGYDLSDYILITDIKRDIGNDVDIDTDDAPKIGENIQHRKVKAKEIEVEFRIWSKDRNRLKHRLAGIFNTTEPKRLMFSDEPDKYYRAMIFGKIEMQESDNRWSDGSMIFIVPDGTARSSTYKRVAGQTNYIDKSSIAITNEGSIEAFPIITIQHSAENGYVGIVNQNGVMELGNRNESDTVKAQRSEYLLKFEGDDGVANAIAGAKKNVAILNDPVHKMNSNCTIFEQWDKRWIGL